MRASSSSSSSFTLLRPTFQRQPDWEDRSNIVNDTPKLVFKARGQGGLLELLEQFDPTTVGFALLKLAFGSQQREKYTLSLCLDPRSAECGRTNL